MRNRPSKRACLALAALTGWAGLATFPRPAVAAEEPAPSAIVRDSEASFAETMAAREIRRYLYLRTGVLLPLRLDSSVPEGGYVLVGTKQRRSVQALLGEAALKGAVEGLAGQEYALQKTLHGGRSVWLVAGGDGIGALYGAYRFVEHLGVRFYLHGDVLPDTQTDLQIPDMREIGKPLFGLRGIQPFHSFPEGPDWWDLEAYKAVLGQLAKLRLNFFGLHSRGEGPVGPEPTVWVGLSEEIGPGASVKSSYPARHFTTLNAPAPQAEPAWGYRPAKTSDYLFGADALFDRDDYGADYMRDQQPWAPRPLDQANRLFEEFGNLLHDAFAFARRLGIKTCLGTETPLTIPALVRHQLRAAGHDPTDPATVRALYEGMFRRIKQIQPLDYYWLWTPQPWAGEPVPDRHIQATLADLRLAAQAADKVNAPFTLATCGWVLGAPQNPALFDQTLPKPWPMSCLNRNVGFDPVDPAFATLQERPLWAIPWLEDDPALILPQLWVGRLRKDAADALRYGCTGLMGIHWRTRIIGPNIAALAQAAWNHAPWKTPRANTPVPPLNASPDERRLMFQPERHAPCADFYADWTQAEFGPDAARPAAALFTRLDGRLPRPAAWVRGPEGVKPDPRPWEQVAREYAFVDELAALRPHIRGGGNLERFDYWLENFRYLRALAALNCTWARLNDTLAQIQQTKDDQERKRLLDQSALPRRAELINQLQVVQQHLLATVTTRGAMGTVAHWQQHVLPTLLEPIEDQFRQALGQSSFPAPAFTAKPHPGQPRLFVPVTRTALLAGEPFHLEVIILGTQPETVDLHWRPLGIKLFRTFPIPHAARGVYRTTLVGKIASRDFEYYVTAQTPDGELIHPPTAPGLNQTVIVVVPGP